MKNPNNRPLGTNEKVFWDWIKKVVLTLTLTGRYDSPDLLKTVRDILERVCESVLDENISRMKGTVESV